MLRKTILLAFLLAGTLAFLASPSNRLEAASCAEEGHWLCSTEADCKRFLIFWLRCGEYSPTSYWVAH